MCRRPASVGLITGISVHKSFLHSSVASSTVNTTTGFRPILLVEPLETKKYLLKDGNTIKTIVSGVLLDLGQVPATQAMFGTNGLTDLSVVTDAILRQLSVPELLCYSTSTAQKQVKLTAVPYPKLVLASGDIRLDYVENIDNFTLTYNQSGSGLIRLIASVDGGVTWKTYANGVWSTVNHNDLSEVKTSGIPPDVFNSIPFADWMALLGTGKTIRFGYYLEVGVSTDVATTDRLIAQFDMLGSWDLAQPYIDFSYRYTNNSTAQVKLFANGSYKVNYQS